ncbi:hypothetical protein AUP68_00314 [Ilyonectria robusta]
MYPCPPEPVRQKLNCNVTRLRFDLSQPLRLVAPAEATEPVQLRRRRSADVSSKLCSLARVKALDIYVSDKELPAVKLKAFSLAVRQSALQPFDADFPTTLASLYGGSGGKLIDDVSALRNHSDHQPPPYDDLEYSPPTSIKHPSPTPNQHLPSTATEWPPTTAIESTSLPNTASPLPVTLSTENKTRKRRRLGYSSSPDSVGNRTDVGSALADKMRQEMRMLVQRVAQLEMDRQAQQDGQFDAEKLEKRVEQLSDEVDVLRANCEQANDGVDDNEAALLKTQSDLEELTERVDFLLQNGLDSEVEEDMVQRVTDRATTNLLNKSYSFSVNES